MFFIYLCVVMLTCDKHVVRCVSCTLVAILVCCTNQWTSFLVSSVSDVCTAGRPLVRRAE